MLLYLCGEITSTKNFLWGFVISLISSSKYISKLFEVFYMVRAYIDYVLVRTKNDFSDHMKDLKKVYINLQNMY